MERKRSNIFILALICLILVSSLSLDTVFSYFSDDVGASGGTSMGYIRLVSLTNLDGSAVGESQTLESDQTFTGEYKLITDTNINFYVYVFLKGTITPSGNKTHDPDCTDYYADDTDCLDISVSTGYSKLNVKSSDGYTIYYKLCTIQSAGQVQQTFSVSASIKTNLIENGCDYYKDASISLDMKVKTKQADFLEAQEYTLGFSSSLINKDLCSIGFKSSPLYTRINADGVEDSNGSYILFGYYPTTIKADSVTVGSTTDANGYYTGSDGAKYAKLSANPCGSNYTFSNGSTITSGTQYYFKVEPIKWRILTERNGTAMLLCESVIDSCRYYYYDTIYANSRIRAFLNGYAGTYDSSYQSNGFLQKAFTTAEQAIIKTTTVNNAASTTDSSSNPYACANTNDKVYLLSYQDLINTSYGFNSSASNADPARRKQTTDYARANYAYTYTSGDYVNNGCWWTRSPHSLGEAAWVVYGRGGIDGDDAYSWSNGVVPVINITL